MSKLAFCLTLNSIDNWTDHLRRSRLNYLRREVTENRYFQHNGHALSAIVKWTLEWHFCQSSGCSRQRAAAAAKIVRWCDHRPCQKTAGYRQGKKRRCLKWCTGLCSHWAQSASYWKYSLNVLSLNQHYSILLHFSKRKWKIF